MEKKKYKSTNFSYESLSTFTKIASKENRERERENLNLNFAEYVLIITIKTQWVNMKWNIIRNLLRHPASQPLLSVDIFKFILQFPIYKVIFHSDI